MQKTSIPQRLEDAVKPIETTIMVFEAKTRAAKKSRPAFCGAALFGQFPVLVLPRPYPAISCALGADLISR